MEEKKDLEEIRELEGNYRRFYAEIFYSCNGTKDTTRVKNLISTFENCVAPVMGIFPRQNTEYWIEKTALLACEACSNLYKELEDRERVIEGLLVASGYNSQNVQRIIQGINNRRNKLERLACLRAEKKFEEDEKRRRI